MKKELISTCRYYHGEQVCPYMTDDLKHYWEIERIYANGDGEIDAENDSHYNNLGGKDYPGIPRTLLITMFAFWGKGVWDLLKSMPEFRKFVDGYLQAAAEHLSPGEVPHTI